MVKGSLSVSDIAFDAIVGILPEERMTPQPIRLGFSVVLDIGPAAQSGNLALSVDYAKLTHDLQELVIASRFELLETLCWTLANYVLERHAMVTTVEIVCAKPNAIPGSAGPVARLSLNRA